MVGEEATTSATLACLVIVDISHRHHELPDTMTTRQSSIIRTRYLFMASALEAV